MPFYKCGANFRAILTVTANPNSTVRVAGVTTYTAQANADGVAVFVVKRKGSYTITSSYLNYDAFNSATVNISQTRHSYTANIYLDPIFGKGTANTTISSNETWNPSAVDTGVISREYRSLTINSGVTVTAGNRNSGIIIRVLGNCVINGNIVNNLAPRSHSTNLSAYYPSWMINNGRGGNGGAGGDDVWHGTRGGGAGQTGRYYGGGYSGGGRGGYGYDNNNILDGGAGGDATGITTNTSLFVGGAINGAGSYGGGGGGKQVSSTYFGGVGGNGAGGKGGDTYEYSTSSSIWNGGSGGGAGNIGGGVIILYVGGNLTINGALQCNGANGGQSGRLHHKDNVPPASDYWNTIGNAGNGGGAGGGRIYLVHKGGISVVGSLNVSGGVNGYRTYENDPTKEGRSYGNSGGNGDKYHIAYANYAGGAGTPTAL